MKPVRAENTSYAQYEELLLERDRLAKEAGQIWTVYVQTFGQLMTDIFEEKVACIRQKKLIAHYQTAANRGEPIDAEALEKKLEQEMASYQAELRRLIKEHKACMEAGFPVENDMAVRRDDIDFGKVGHRWRIGCGFLRALACFCRRGFRPAIGRKRQRTAFFRSCQLCQQFLAARQHGFEVVALAECREFRGVGVDAVSARRIEVWHAAVDGGQRL